MKTATIDGYRFEWGEHGSGEPIVFVHGSSSDHRTWSAQVEGLASRYRVITYSRRYHWPNDPIVPGAVYSMAQHVDDLIRLLRVHRETFHLVGHSYGALVCLAATLEAPELVRSLVLVEPPALRLFTSDPPKPAELVRLLFARPYTAASIVGFGIRGVAPTIAALERGDIDGALEIHGRAVLGTDAFEALSQERLEQGRANFIPQEILGPGFPPIDVAAVRALRLPVLMVNGTRSPHLFRHLSDGLAELLADVDRRTIVDAGHIVHEDQPAAFNVVVDRFVCRSSFAPLLPSRTLEM